MQGLLGIPKKPELLQLFVGHIKKLFLRRLNKDLVMTGAFCTFIGGATV